MVWILGLLGLMIGALLNLLADSLPTAYRVRRPRCAYCGRDRPLAALSAVSALLTGHRRCPHCGAPVSLRHLLVELSTALLFAFCWLRTGASLQTAFHIVYSSVFVLIVVTDIEHRLIQHVITLPAIAVALVGAFVNPVFDSPKRALLGGAIGLGATFALYLLGGLFVRVMSRARGQAISEVAFGFGDVVLNAFLGLIVGAPHIIFAMTIGFLCGGLAATAFLLVRGLIQRRYKLFTPIPYGPFLIVGGAVMLYYGREFMSWYLTR